jgi:hypothetical protein
LVVTNTSGGAVQLGRVVKLFLIVVAAVAGTAADAGASARRAPDLVVTRVAGLPSSGNPGGALPLKVSVRNAGAARARASRLRLTLSADDRPDASDAPLASPLNVSALKTRKTAALSARPEVPRSLAPGSYRVIACADGDRQVRERSEKNNCRASGVVQVTSSGTLTSPGGPGGPELTPGPTGPAGVTTPAETGTPGPDGTGPGSGPDPAADHAPRNVKVTVDQNDGASGTIGPSGGTLQFSREGTTWRLTIPAGALPESTPVTMRPVTGIGDYPFEPEGRVAVQLGPDGLTLLKPAVLEIIPAPAIDPAKFTTFAWHGSGDGFHLYPTLPDSWRLAFEIHHFSGYGVGPATGAQRAEQLGHPPASAMDEAEQALGALSRDQHECRASGSSCRTSDEVASAIVDALRDSYPQVLANLTSATTDEASDAAIAAAFAWMRQVQLASLDSTFTAETTQLQTAIGSTIKTAYERAWRRCASYSDAPAALRRMVSLARMAQLGVGGPLDETRFDRCIRFRLSVESKFTVTRAHTPENAEQIDSTYTVRVDDILLIPVGINTFERFSGSGKPAIGENTLEKRWCTDDSGETPVEFLCRQETGVQQSMADSTAVVGFAYPTAGTPTLDVIFPRTGVDVERKVVNTASDGTSNESTTTVHDVGWTEQLPAFHPAEVQRAMEVNDDFSGLRGNNWIRPTLEPAGSGIWKWQSPSASGSGSHADTAVTLDYSGGEGG